MKKVKEEKFEKNKKGLLKKILIVFGIIMIILVLIVVILICINKIGLGEIEENNNKMSSVMTQVKNEKTNYVFLEINPKFALEVKGDKIQKLWCLNDDCKKIQSKIKIDDMTLYDGVEHIYNVTKDNGFKVDGGVTIKSVDSLDKKIQELSYVNVKYINLEEQEKLLKINEKEDNAPNVSNNSLLEKLKQDEDYGVIYECNESATECYIKSDLYISFNSLETYIKRQLPILYRVRNVLNRFGIETESVKEGGLFEEPFFIIYINGNKFIALDNERYLGRINCLEYTIKLTEINLMNLGDITSKAKPFEYSSMGDMRDGQVIESDPICGDKWCKQKTQTTHITCNSNNINPDVNFTDEYYIYKKDNSIRYEATYDEWMNLDVATGPLEDLPLCETVYDEGNIFAWRNPYKDTYCKFKNESGEWRTIEPFN